MEIRIEGRSRIFLLILIPFVVGSLLGFTASKYIEPEPPIVHHVTTGKVGTNVDGTGWVSEYFRGREVFNYTLPYGAVYSWFVSYADVFTVAVPLYSQDFELERMESGDYNVYIPERDVSVPVKFLAEYLQDLTILDRAYRARARRLSIHVRRSTTISSASPWLRA